jgi:hypothetical protein
MTMRMMVALSATLLLVGSTWAQPPDNSFPTQPPDVSGDAPAPSAFALPTPPGGDGRFWVSGDYAAYWISGSRLPALVTTSPAGTAQSSAGVLGQPSTTTLFGGNVANDDIRSGLRFGAGYWLGEDRKLGIEAGFFMLESQSSLFSASSSTVPILARPFTDATTFSQQAVLVAYPGLTTGAIGAQVSSGNFYEAHFDFAYKVLEGAGPLRLDALLGYRFFQFNEGLRVQQNMAPTSPNFVAGTTIQAEDDFGVANQFHGLDLGLRPRFVWESLTLDLLAKVSVGDLYQQASVLGAQVITVPGAPAVQQPGGVLALGTNNGSYHSSVLAVVPEFGATLGWRITPNVQVRLGYSALMLNQVARVGDEVNTTVNSNRFPGLNPPGGGINEPAFSFNRNNTWINGATLGIEISY